MNVKKGLAYFSVTTIFLSLLGCWSLVGSVQPTPRRTATAPKQLVLGTVTSSFDQWRWFYGLKNWAYVQQMAGAALKHQATRQFASSLKNHPKSQLMIKDTRVSGHYSYLSVPVYIFTVGLGFVGYMEKVTVSGTAVLYPEGAKGIRPSFKKVENVLFVDGKVKISRQMRKSKHFKELEGTSWRLAFNELQPAIDKAAKEGYTEIWVAEGIYVPRLQGIKSTFPTTPQSHFYALHNNLAIYGGFLGNELSLKQRDIKKNKTILSGNDRLYHIIFNPPSLRINRSAVLDGFIIEGGRADSPFSAYQRGGGIYNVSASPTLSNLILRNNTGEGAGKDLYNAYESDPVVDNVVQLSE